MSDMSIFSILNTGVLGTYTAKLAMSVTAHNISNTNTPGFSRQRPEIVATTPMGSTSLHQSNSTLTLGTGSMVKRVERIRDQFLDTQYRVITENHSFWDNKSSNLHYMEQLLNEPAENGFREYFDKMWFSFQEVMSNPTNEASIQSVKSEVNNFISTFKDLYGRFEELRENLNNDIKDTVDQINTITSQIGNINAQLRMSYIADSEPNDILDERDKLLDELNQYANTTVKKGDLGHLEIYIGQQVVVHGDQTTPIKTAVRPETLNSYDLFVRSTKIDVQKGKLGAMMELRDVTIPAYLDKYDEMALMMADKLNLIHQAGYDKSGKISGINLFKEMEQTRTALPNLFRMAGTNAILNGPIHMASSEISTNPSGTSLGLSGDISFVDLNNFLFDQAISTDTFATNKKFDEVIESLNELELYSTYAKNITIDDTANSISLTNFQTYTGGGSVFYKTTTNVEYANDGVIYLPNLIDINGDGDYTGDDIKIINTADNSIEYNDYTYDIATGILRINDLPDDFDGNVTIEKWENKEMTINDGMLDYSTVEDELVSESIDNIKVYIKKIRADVMRTTDLLNNPTGKYNMFFGTMNDGIDQYGNVDTDTVNSFGDLKDLLILDNNGILERLGYNTTVKSFLKIADFSSETQTYLRDGLEGIWWLDGFVNQNEFDLDKTSKQISLLDENLEQYESSFSFADSADYDFTDYDNTGTPNTVDLELKEELADYNGSIRVLYSTRNNTNTVNTVTNPDLSTSYKVQLNDEVSIHDGNGDGVIDGDDVKIYNNNTASFITGSDLTVNQDGTITINSGWVPGDGDVDVVYYEEARREINASPGEITELNIDQDVIKFSDGTTTGDATDFQLKYVKTESEETFNDPVHIFYVAEEKNKTVTLSQGAFQLDNLIDINDDGEISTDDLRLKIGGTEITDFEYDSENQEIQITDPTYATSNADVTMDIRRWVKSFQKLEDGTLDYTQLNQDAVSLDFDGTLSKADFQIYKEPLVNIPQEIPDPDDLKSITFTVPVEQDDGSTKNQTYNIEFYNKKELVTKINNNLNLKDYIKAFEYEGAYYISSKGSLEDISNVVVNDEYNLLNTVDLKVLDIDSYNTLNNIMYSYNEAYAGDYEFDTFTSGPPETVELTLKQNLNEYNGKIKVKYATRSQNPSNSNNGYEITNDNGNISVNLGSFEIKDTNQDGRIDREDIKLFENGSTTNEITNFVFDSKNRTIQLNSDPGVNVDIFYWKDDVYNVNGNDGTTYELELSDEVYHFKNPDDSVDETEDFFLSVQLPPDQMQMTLGTTDINVSLNTTTMDDLIEQINNKVPAGIISDLTPDNKLVFRAGTSADYSFGRVLEDGRIVQTYGLDAPTIFWEKMGYLGFDGTFGGAWKNNTDVVNNYLNDNALLHNQVSSNNLDIDGRQANGLYDFTKRLELSSQIESNPLLLAVDYGRWTDLDGDWVADLHTPRGGSNVSSTSIISRLSEARYDLLINDGNTSFVDFFGTFVSEMGIEAQTAMRMTSNNQMMLTQIDNERERVKGVSLDEEMSNMIKYQQAFNAAARVVTAVDEMIQRIIDGLGIVGR